MNAKHLMIAATMLIGGTVFAQDETRKVSEEQKMNKLMEELDMTQDEAAEFMEVLKQNKEDRKALKAKARDSMKDEREAMQEKHEARVRAALTDEQLVRWEELKAERKARMQERKKGKRKAYPEKPEK